MSLLHATGVFFEGKGILLMGPSGAGKSDLALRLMARGAELVGDDYLEIQRESKGRLTMRGAPNIAGKIEVRSVGILEVPCRAQAPVDMIFNLVAPVVSHAIDRLPEVDAHELEGVVIPSLDFNGLEVSAPEKISAALKIVARQKQTGSL